ncbi:hypothetical protein [Streptomyces longisporus]|uniref:hypothetical protein n=1 Tax=Streptomyces longisporus TaxID=1948 RepID=UPI0031D534C4
MGEPDALLVGGQQPGPGQPLHHHPHIGVRPPRAPGADHFVRQPFPGPPCP